MMNTGRFSVFLICLKSLMIAEALIEYNQLLDSKCPIRDTDADLILAGVFPVHVEVTADNCNQANSCGYSLDKQIDGSTKCIRINKSGITWVEAMIKTIREINEDRRLLPGIRLGYIICDGYNNIDRALNISLMLQSLRHTVMRYSNVTENKCSCRNNDTRTIVGLIGGASSKISMNLNYILNVFDIPQISYSSTSPSLSDKFNFRTFFRTIPPDTYQGKALADIIRYFGWAYVSTVATSDDYGRLGIEAFKEATKDHDICIGVEALFDITLNLQSTKDQITEIVSNLKAETKAKVVILFCEWPSAQAILQEAEKQNLTGKTWIASEAWGENNFVLGIREDVIGGMIGLIPMQGNIEAFKTHVVNIDARNYAINTWFKEYYYSTLKCKNLTASSNVSIHLDYSFSKCANVMDAVYALAHALHKELGCDVTGSLPTTECNWLKEKKAVNMQNLLTHLKNITFTGALDVPMSFDSNGDPIGGYLITNLQNNTDGSMKFTRIGRWDGRQRQLHFTQNTTIYWNGWVTQVSRSSCSKPCAPGYFGIPGKSKCCWECFRCQDGFVKWWYGEDSCKKCSDDYVTNANKTQCIKLIERYLHWSDVEAIVICVISFSGGILVLVSLILFIRLRSTPIVKASSLELSYFLLVTLLMIFLTPAIYIGKPTKILCIMRPMSTGLLMAIATSILSVRAYRYMCIFKLKFHKKATKLQGLSSQFASVFVASLSPVGVIAIYFAFQNPHVVNRIVLDKDSPKVYTECNLETQYVSLGLAGYLLCLSVVCCALAFRTRKLPEVFNDAKWLAMTIFTQNIVWFASMTIYIARHNDRAMVMCINVFVSGFVIWGFNFLPKLVTIILHPERNRRDVVSRQIFMMTRHRVDRDHPGKIEAKAVERYLRRGSNGEVVNRGELEEKEKVSGDNRIRERRFTNINLLDPVALTDINR
eukprot:gene8073-13989_t